MGSPTAGWLVTGLVVVVGLAGGAAGKYMTYDQVKGRPYSVAYNNRSFTIDGENTLLLGAGPDVLW